MKYFVALAVLVVLAQAVIPADKMDKIPVNMRLMFRAMQMIGKAIFILDISTLLMQAESFTMFSLNQLKALIIKIL